MVRNGYHQERELVTGSWEGSGAPTARTRPQANGALHQCHPTTVSTAHAQHRRLDSGALPEGCSTSAFPEALQAILGDGVAGLSAHNVVRLKQVWEQEFQAWSKRDLHGKRYVYLWADAVYFNVRLQKDRPCVLVVVGATEDGHKELLAIQDGERESHLSWLHLLQDLKA